MLTQIQGSVSLATPPRRRREVSVHPYPHLAAVTTLYTRLSTPRVLDIHDGSVDAGIPCTAEAD